MLDLYLEDIDELIPFNDATMDEVLTWICTRGALIGSTWVKAYHDNTQKHSHAQVCCFTHHRCAMLCPYVSATWTRNGRTERQSSAARGRRRSVVKTTGRCATKFDRSLIRSRPRPYMMPTCACVCSAPVQSEKDVGHISVFVGGKLACLWL